MSEYKNAKLWKLFINKAASDGNVITAVEKICDFAVDRASKIDLTFPLYTRHDEVHICNVMNIMIALLGEKADEISKKEAAMLVLAAACHDLGMSYSDDEKKALLADTDRVNDYLSTHSREYVNAYKNGADEPSLDEDTASDFLRSIHHERVGEVLDKISDEWKGELNKYFFLTDLTTVCQSHGCGISDLRATDFDYKPNLDLTLCAVLLRLADILDFDASRAPKTLYDFCGFNGRSKPSEKFSEEEWKKHRSSVGFDFAPDPNTDRSKPYLLHYRAECEDINIDRGVNLYIDWVDKELANCIAILNARNITERVVLPYRIKRDIKAINYISGDFTLNLNKDRILKLFSGVELYGDEGIFVRELIQNAVDAVLALQDLGKAPRRWKPQINITTWTDDDGYYWFRIEDNGLGMTEEIIYKYFLTAGNSYYISDDFKMLKDECGGGEFSAISRFGIGILSCFFDSSNRIELSTRYYDGSDCLRMTMDGANGYYNIASKERHNKGFPMPGKTKADRFVYRKSCGTSIAVKTDLFKIGKYGGYRELVDRYVVCPPVPVHFDGVEGIKDYYTEQELAEDINSFHYSDDREQSGVFSIPFPNEIREKLQERLSFLPPKAFPEKLDFKLIDLSRYSGSGNISGFIIAPKTTFSEFHLTFCEKYYPVKMKLILTRNICQYEVSEESNEYLDALRELGRKFAIDPDDSVDTIKIKTGVENEDAKQFKRLIADEKEIILKLHRLPLSDWFQKGDFDISKLFPKYKPMGNYASYNGIMCSRRLFLYDFFLGFINFKSSFCPLVNVSRTYIQSLPTEACFELADIFNQLLNEGITSTENFFSNLLRSDAPFRTPANKLMHILDKRPDIKENTVFDTPEGVLNQMKIIKIINDNEKLRINLPVRYLYFLDGPKIIYRSIQLTELARCFDFEFEYDKDCDEFCFYAVKKDEQSKSKIINQYFPPAFFSEYKGEIEQMFYVNSDYLSFSTFNLRHRLSAFLIDNADELNKKAPDVFRQFIRTMHWNLFDIEAINRLIALLRNMRAVNKISCDIPDGLELTEEEVNEVDD